MTASTVVLALNAGSSSLKFGLFDVDGTACRALMSGVIDAGAAMVARDENGRPLDVAAEVPADAQAAVAAIARLSREQQFKAPDVVGHRFVHGGPRCRTHSLIDAEVTRALQDAVAFAPLHAPASLALLQAAQAHFADIPQVACLDTAFHNTMPAVSRTLPLPPSLREQGIERYGFHGLSCESIVPQLGCGLPAKLVIAHLGHGASVTAVANGRSVDTSMGLTPSGGVMMSTRTGDIDPGVLLYLMREGHADASTLEALIDQQSGLLGVSSISGDMRRLRAAGSSTDARLAIAMFCYSVRKQIGAMAAVLGGIDLLVFTGGIGENDALARADICARLDVFGIRDTDVPGSRARVLPSQEDVQIARHARDLMLKAGDATVASPSLSN
ncbi:MAG: acetate kinase [Xanthomonadaceae bacterium]|nr:acetate kinase [Xanthomonadaceae bacterium]